MNAPSADTLVCGSARHPTETRVAWRSAALGCGLLALTMCSPRTGGGFLPPTMDASAGDVAVDVGALGETMSGCTCGDGVCATLCGESLSACPYDCKVCGDGVCSPGENPAACGVDCCGACGDGKCMGFACGEPVTCGADCATPCGDGQCNKGETPAICVIDCAWQVCGNGVCEPGDGGSSVCPVDCGTACGNCVCDKGEDFMNCPIDCGFCGDGVCSTCATLAESAQTCPSDCVGGKKACTSSAGCPDDGPCLAGTCGPDGFCGLQPTAGACDDGDACTQQDACQAGSCKGVVATCDDGDPCTIDGCAGGACTHQPPAGGACSGGTGVCSGGTCAFSAVQIAAGGGSTCARRQDGTVWCWGDAGYGHLVLDPSPEFSATPVAIQLPQAAQHISVSQTHACAVLAGAVWCWGHAYWGALGDGTTKGNLAPVAAKGLPTMQQVACGNGHTCALSNDGAVWCWGYNKWGQVGIGKSDLPVLTPTKVDGMPVVQGLASSTFHTCAWSAAGAAWCWGRNGAAIGQWEPGKPFDTDKPWSIDGLPPLASLRPGVEHTCARSDTGEGWCWGANAKGQIGNGTTGASALHTAVTGMGKLQDLVASHAHTCAIDGKGDVWCWGWGEDGQLGNEQLLNSPSPVHVNGPGGAVELALGGAHSCVRNQANMVFCWGSWQTGHQGDVGKPVATPPVPVPVPTP